MLALPHPEQQESSLRENGLDPLACEQTWPTEEVRGRSCRREGGVGRPPPAG